MATKLASGYVDLSVHYADALKQIRRAFDNLDDAEIDVDAKTAGATANMGRWRTKEEAKPVNLRVDVDTKMASTKVRGLRRDLESLGRSDFLKINLGVAGISSLPALATGLAEVAAAMAQLSQAALVIPGGIAGAVSSIGTLAFGLTGVTDAYEAMNKAADESAKSGRDVAAQARSQQSASYSLRNAITDEAQARGDVSRAIRDQRRDMQDLDLQMRGGITSEKRAILEAQKARERLYSGDFSDYREALLDVEEADLRIEEVRNRNVRTSEDLAEANAKGIHGSDRVVAANERLVRSQQGVVMAQGAVAAAAETTTAAQEDADLAMGKLSQNGRKFVQALMDVQGPIQTLRNLVQDNIFAGLDTDLTSLAGKAMPTFERGLGGIGDAWNRSFKEMFRLAGDDKNLGILERIFGNTTEAQDILTNGLEPLTNGLLTLTEAGADALPRLADGFVAVSERFANFITAADEDGRLDEWIDEGITALGHLGETLLNLGKIFTGISDATQGSLLENLEKWTTHWATWVNSVEGQNTLKDFFAEGRRVFEQWRPILEDLPGIFKSIYDAASTFASAVTTILSPITEILKDFPILAETAALAFLIFKSAQVLGAVGTLFGKLTGLSTMLGTTLPNDAKKGAGKINAALALIAVPMIGKMITDDIDEWLKENYPDLYKANHTNTPDKLGKKARDWVDENILGQGPIADGTLGGGPNASRQRRGKDPVGPFGGGGGSVVNSILGGNAPGFGGEGRDLINAAYQQQMDLGSTTEDTGGGVLPLTQALIDRYKSWGIENTGGYREPDGFNEHSSGKAADIMIPNWDTEEGKAMGDAVTMDALKMPGVEYVIWRNEMWYPDGRREPYSGYGATSDPTLMHMDHPHIKTFDKGGWWKDGELGINTTGEDELVLNPDHLDHLTQQGIDPNALIHGNGQGALPGPTPDQAGPYQPIDPATLGERTGGYIPAAAGNTSKAGTSFLSGIYGMGAEVINGMIDQAASVASSAAGMAASAFAPGSGGAAAGAAQAGIGMATGALKRGVEYGAQMLGIGTDAIIEQLTPFGAPRILTTDPTGFMPQQLLSGAVGKMIQAGQPGMPGQPMPGMPGQPPAPGTAVPPGVSTDHSGAGVAPGVPNPPGPPPGIGQTVGHAQPDPNQMTALDFLKPLGVYDNGGWLPPGGLAINKTRSHEPMPVFNSDQWGTLNSIANSPVSEPAMAGGGPQYNYTIHTTVKDVKELERQMVDRRQLDTMRYRGRG